MGELRISQATLDDAVNEAQGERMIFHLHRGKIIEEELRDSLDNDGVEPVEERLGGFDGSLTLDVIGREKIVANEHVS